MNEHLDKGPRALVAALRDKRLSAVELMAGTLDRIDAVNGTVNAIVGLRDRETLMAEAREMPIAIRAGDRSTGCWWPSKIW